MRSIVYIILIIVIVSLTAYFITQRGEVTGPDDDFYLSQVSFRLEYPEEVSQDEEITVKIFVDRTDETTFPMTLDFIRFPFSDFQFIEDGNLATDNIDVDVLLLETEVLEYNVKRNENSFGSGVISGVMEFGLHIEDPEYGSRDLIKGEDFLVIID